MNTCAPLKDWTAAKNIDHLTRLMIRHLDGQINAPKVVETPGHPRTNAAIRSSLTDLNWFELMTTRFQHAQHGGSESRRAYIIGFALSAAAQEFAEDISHALGEDVLVRLFPPEGGEDVEPVPVERKDGTPSEWLGAFDREANIHPFYGKHDSLNRELDAVWGIQIISTRWTEAANDRDIDFFHRVENAVRDGARERRAR